MSADVDNELLDQADGLLGRFQVPATAIAVGVDDDGETRLLGNSGPGDVFEVASLSKTATAVAVMRLVEQGRIRLDDPVNAHLRSWELPDDGFDAGQVTIRRLLSHTGGLPEGIPASELDEPPELGARSPSLIEVLEGAGGRVRAEVVRYPGSSFVYSNPGYGVLELMIQDVTGKAYIDAMQDLVFAPLQMDNTGFQDDAAFTSRTVPGHRSAGHPVSSYRRLPHAAGGLLSTGPDIARLIGALVTPAGEGGLLTSDSLEELSTVPDEARGAFGLGDNGGYALGMAAGTLPGGRRFVANNGSHEGYNALFVAVPDNRAYLVVLTNAETGIGLELELALRWFDAVIGERPAIATTFVKIRRAVDLGSQAMLALRTLPAVAGGAALVLLLNTGVLTGPIGGLPPSRLISSHQQTVTLGLFLALSVTGTVATAAPRVDRAQSLTSEPARSTVYG